LSVKFQVTFKGWQEIADQFRDLPGFDDTVQNALLSVGERMRETAMQIVPVRTGMLKASIRVEERGHWDVLLAARTTYAIYVEFGTRRMAARLFLTRATQQHEPELKDEVCQAAFKVVMERLGGY
jgi:HK97 gp10 family phage protein